MIVDDEEKVLMMTSYLSLLLPLCACLLFFFLFVCRHEVPVYVEIYKIETTLERKEGER